MAAPVHRCHSKMPKLLPFLVPPPPPPGALAPTVCVGVQRHLPRVNGVQQRGEDGPCRPQLVAPHKVLLVAPARAVPGRPRDM